MMPRRFTDSLLWRIRKKNGLKMSIGHLPRRSRGTMTWMSSRKDFGRPIQKLTATTTKKANGVGIPRNPTFIPSGICRSCRMCRLGDIPSLMLCWITPPKLILSITAVAIKKATSSKTTKTEKIWSPERNFTKPSWQMSRNNRKMPGWRVRFGCPRPMPSPRKRIRMKNLLPKRPRTIMENPIERCSDMISTFILYVIPLGRRFILSGGWISTVITSGIIPLEVVFSCRPEGRLF
mmetsp:Transcript_32099/g.63914  ORF Transcript_32099/g.63914 Transcript_32099/m.63914 type:complete len:235 (+) Transcript_32099:384-1088(+)